MSIFGCLRWNDRDAFYDQTNNPTEQVLKHRLPPNISPLETCGPTAAVNCLAAMGLPVRLTTPGGYEPQPEEVLSDWFNDPKNFGRMKSAWAGLDPSELCANEVTDWYPEAVHAVFGHQAWVIENLSDTTAVVELKQGHALQVGLKSPGHYLALTAYDDVEQVFYLNDSWGGRWPDGDGFCKKLSRSDFSTQLKPKALVYGERSVRQ